MAMNLLLIDSNNIHYFFPLGESLLSKLKDDLESERITIEYWESSYKIISDMIEQSIEINDLEKINNFIKELEWSMYGEEMLNTYYDLGVIKNLNIREIENTIENSSYYDIENYIKSGETYEEAIGRTLIECYGYLEIPENIKEFIDYKKICENALSKEWYFDNENYILVNTKTI